jgi:hypothetical protein
MIIMDDEKIGELMGLGSKGPCKRCGKQAPYIGGHFDGNTFEDVPEFLCETCEDDSGVLVRVASVSPRH